MLAALAMAAAALSAEIAFESSRAEGPEGVSALAHISGDRYYCVDDRGGWLHEVTIEVGDGKASFATNRAVRLAGRKDLEGCALDPLTRNVWVADENDTSVRAFDPSTGREVASLEMPEVYRKHVRKYRSLESLAISPDGLRLYTANEENLSCDPTNVVRIQEFVRKGADDEFRPSRQFVYEVDPPGGRAFRKKPFSGVSALLVMADGSLLVLEREFSVKTILPSFRSRLYHIVPGKPGKELVWGADMGFSNYESICFGPRLRDGRKSLILVSDGGAGAFENILVLALKP